MCRSLDRHRAPRRAARALVVLCIAAGCTVAACAPNAIVALPSTASRWIDPFTAKARADSGVSVKARTRGWPGPPLDLGERATPVLVHVENGGAAPLKIARGSFELVTGTARFRAMPPDQIGLPRSDLRQRELKSGTLDPGQSESGFVYFEPAPGRWGFIHLRAYLVDATSDELIGTLDVPFSSGELVSCTLEGAREEAPTDRDILFRSCPLP